MSTNAMVDLLIYLLIGGLIVFVVYWIVGMLTLDARLKQVVLVVISVIVAIWLILTFIPRFT